MATQMSFFVGRRPYRLGVADPENPALHAIILEFCHYKSPDFAIHKSRQPHLRARIAAEAERFRKEHSLAAVRLCVLHCRGPQFVKWVPKKQRRTKSSGPYPRNHDGTFAPSGQQTAASGAA